MDDPNLSPEKDPPQKLATNHPKKKRILQNCPISAGNTHLTIINRGVIYSSHQSKEISKNPRKISFPEKVVSAHSSENSLVIATKSGKIYGWGKFSERIVFSRKKEIFRFPGQIQKVYHNGIHITVILRDGLAYLLSLTGWGQGKLIPFPFKIIDLAYHPTAGFYMIDLPGKLYSWPGWFRYFKSIDLGIEERDIFKSKGITARLVDFLGRAKQVVISGYHLMILSDGKNIENMDLDEEDKGKYLMDKDKNSTNGKNLANGENSEKGRINENFKKEETMFRIDSDQDKPVNIKNLSLSMGGQVYSWEIRPKSSKNGISQKFEKVDFLEPITHICLKNIARLAVSVTGKLYIWGTDPRDVFKDQQKLTPSDKQILEKVTVQKNLKSQGVPVELHILERPIQLDLGYPIEYVAKGENFILAKSEEGDYLLVD